MSDMGEYMRALDIIAKTNHIDEDEDDMFDADAAAEAFQANQLQITNSANNQFSSTNRNNMGTRAIENQTGLSPRGATG